MSKAERDRRYRETEGGRAVRRTLQARYQNTLKGAIVAVRYENKRQLRRAVEQRESL